MSRTFRTNKLGEVKTDKFVRDFNGCGCAYCEYINTDNRPNHINKRKITDIKEGLELWDTRYDDHDEF